MADTGIGFDPGKVNCAYAVWRSGKVQASDVIEGIESVDRLPNFIDHVARVFDWYAPTVCAVERYQLRRGTGFVGNMELVNIMIGAICCLCRERGIPVHLVLAATHKTWAQQHGAVKRKGKLSTYTCPDLQHLKTEHEADAANVIRYAIEKKGK